MENGGDIPCVADAYKLDEFVTNIGKIDARLQHLTAA